MSDITTYTNPTPSLPFKLAITGPYLTASAGWIAGWRSWPLVIMTAIAGSESGWNNDPGHTDNNGATVTGLWQLQPSTNADVDPITNAKHAYAKAGGNTLAGLGNWALTPPGGTSITGVSQPNPYPWGTVPPVLKGDSGYYENGTFVQHNYALTASQVAQAIYAVGQVLAFGPATKAELNSAAGWGTTGANASTTDSNDASNSAGSQGGGDTSTGGGGCDSTSYLISILGLNLLNKCQLKAIKGGMLTLAGGAVLLFGGALVVISGLAGKGPLAPVVNVAQGYVGAAKRLPGVGKSASTAAEDSRPPTSASDTRAIAAARRKTETRSEDQGVNYKGGKPLRSVKDPWEGQGMAEDAA
jgi:hypothetical protein